MDETRIKGVYQAKDFADFLQSDYISGIHPGDECGWQNLSVFYSIKRGQLSVVTGIPNHGKSTWLDNLMVNLARRRWRFLVCSPENQPIQRHIQSLIEIYKGKRYACPKKDLYPEQCLTEQELAEGLSFVQKHFQFIYPEETDFHIDYIIQLAQAVKAEWDFSGFVIDPYNELEPKRPAGMSETEYISLVLSKFRRFCRKSVAHGWMVAHPTKLKELSQPQTEAEAKKQKIYAMPSLYDIAGSANWRNKADMGIVVYRDFSQKPEKTVISVQKVRFRECGKIGQTEFVFDTLCNRFVEREDELLFFKTRGAKCD